MATESTSYDFTEIERHWQDFWAERKTFAAEDFADKPTWYVLDMFPYPSGAGLHIGHPEGYTATDALKRFKKAQGHNVLHPMGWDAFGLPTEQFAIKTGEQPAIVTARNIENFKKQLRMIGLAYDWDREVNTTDPAYFKWTQWIFLKLFQAGLAYVDEKPVWFCPDLGTVLANPGRQVVDGHNGTYTLPSAQVLPVPGCRRRDLYRLSRCAARMRRQGELPHRAGTLRALSVRASHDAAPPALLA